MWRLDPVADPVLRRRHRRAEGGDPRRHCAPCPTIGPDRTLRFVELPAGQDPDDVVRTGGREAFEALLAEPEPLDARLWRHEVEARAADHARSLGRPQAAADRPCRGDRPPRPRPHLSRGLAQPLLRAAPPRCRRRARHAAAAAAASGTAASSPPPRPVDAEARAIAAAGIDAPDRPRADPRLRQFPRGAARPLRAARGACRSPTRRPRKMRDELVNAAFSGATLDRRGACHHIGRRWSNGPESLKRHGLFLHPPRQRSGPRPKRSGRCRGDHRRGGGGGQGPRAMQRSG